MPFQQEGDQMQHTLVMGSHILHYHGVLDAYGHLSARHPNNPDVFIMPRNLAPASISTQEDLVEYHVSDASPAHSNAPKGYIERYIHSEIYKKYPNVQSVIHSHASAVLPYSISGVPIKLCYHMAGALVPSIPNFDIAKHYQSDSVRDLLIRDTDLGCSLAAYFSSNQDSESSKIDSNVVLMRGHGFTTVASSIQQCVFQAIFMKENASIQTQTLLLSMAHQQNTGEQASEIQYLHDDEIEPTKAMTEASGERAWGLWVQEVTSNSLYSNRC